MQGERKSRMNAWPRKKERNEPNLFFLCVALNNKGKIQLYSLKRFLGEKGTNRKLNVENNPVDGTVSFETNFNHYRFFASFLALTFVRNGQMRICFHCVICGIDQAKDSKKGIKRQKMERIFIHFNGVSMCVYVCVFILFLSSLRLY